VVVTVVFLVAFLFEEVADLFLPLFVFGEDQSSSSSSVTSAEVLLVSQR